MSSAIWNVGIVGENENDQISTQRLLVFLEDEYNESSESFIANEDDVPSSPNFFKMCRRKALPIGHNNWHGKECDL